MSFALGSIPVASAPEASPSGIADVAVSFPVINGNAAHDNDSKVSCNPGLLPGLQFATDDRKYTVLGRIVGPRSALDGRARSATIYLHGASTYVGFAADIPGHNYALQMAQLGHVSVVIEGLGYGANGVDHTVNGVSTFNGNDYCFGAMAEVIHQIIGELRVGAYAVAGQTPAPAFSRVAIAGHSGGEGPTEIEAYSWHDADAVALLGDVDPSTTAIPVFDAHVAAFVAKCELGGDPSYPNGYGFLWLTPDFEAQDIFYDQSDPLIPAFERQIRPDPCGLLSNSGDASATDPHTGTSYAAEITAPVLLLWGDRDSLCPTAAPDGSNCPEHLRQVFTAPTHELTVVRVCETKPYLCGSTHSGHELIFEDAPAAAAFRAAMNDWLNRHGF